MNRAELTDPRRFVNHALRGLGGVSVLLRDYADEGGIIASGDVEYFRQLVNDLQQTLDRLSANTEEFDRS